MCRRSSARESTRLKTELSHVQVLPAAPLQVIVLMIWSIFLIFLYLKNSKFGLILLLNYVLSDYFPILDFRYCLSVIPFVMSNNACNA